MMGNDSNEKRILKQNMAKLTEIIESVHLKNEKHWFNQ